MNVLRTATTRIDRTGFMRVFYNVVLTVILLSSSIHGQDRCQSSLAIMRQPNWIANILSPAAMIPAVMSLTSDKVALTSSLVNAAATLIPTAVGLLMPQEKLTIRYLKVANITLMFVSTMAAGYSWFIFPGSSNQQILSLNNGTVPFVPVALSPFEMSYLVNVSVTSFAASLSLASLIYPLCRWEWSSSVENEARELVGHV